MTSPGERTMIAEFGDPEALAAAARGVRERGGAALDALSPYPVEGLDEALGLRLSPLRWPMLIAALVAAAFAYGMEWWSAVIGYPFHSGGRPLNSWPVFLLVPLEVGVLVAALAGFVAFLMLCGLPRLRHPVFDWDSVERASVDRFFLLVSAPDNAEPGLRQWLLEARALRVEAAPP